MKIRLIGTTDQCDTLVATLRTLPTLAITDVSGPYPSRRNPDQFRVYLDADLIDAAAQRRWRP
ncbi:hypothetical protein [Actinoplanes regularis]|uniref:hypothetical protein n=1 Tax=Actinoplanes regularis TaxID=52697 RepID=UPI0024A28A0F|nr:hypothetical protein [Actinoplanes regularis]GLW31889.1 hypothetical protein Areg01_48280 [Actinoplanes regularis]